MARPKLYDSSQPFLVRAIFWFYELFASLKLAVLLILTIAVMLGLATFVEANYGTAAVRFLMYHTWFFVALLSLLALNIFCAAAIRFPWKRHQTGFVITHIGLLTLLTGSAISDRGSVNSQLRVSLGESNHVAADIDQSILNVSNIPGHPEPLSIRLHLGPFNWSDLAPWPVTRRVKSWFGLDNPAQTWVHPPQVVYNDGKTKLEIVNYYSRSEIEGTPYLSLRFYQPKIKVEIPVELSTRPGEPFAKAALGMMGDVVMWHADSAEALTAFKKCVPDRHVENDGTVAFWWKGETTCATVRELQKLKAQGKRFELNDGLSIELGAFAESADLRALVSGKGLVPPGPDEQGLGPTVEFFVVQKVDGKETKSRVLRFAEYPFMPGGKQPTGFVAELYHPSVKGRVDILTGPDNTMAYRAWQKAAGRVAAAGDLEIGKTVDTFSMGGGDSVMKMTALKYVGAGAEGENKIGRDQMVMPLPFEKGDEGLSKCVRLRLSWTDSSGNDRHDTFWLTQNLPEPFVRGQKRHVHDTETGGDKPIVTSLNVWETDVGFDLKLVDFDLEVDPGTKQAANYTSRVIQVDVRNDPEVERLRERVNEASDPTSKQAARDELATLMRTRIDSQLETLKGKSSDEQRKLADGSPDMSSLVITMNRPLDYPDLEGRQLRFFQENYVAPNKELGTPLGSVFRVNYDPGRPVKYLGSGLIVFGIFLMFYMRAYFFKRPAQGAVT